MGKHGPPLTVSRYMTESRPGHPVAHADGRVRIHRAVLYDEIGPGPHACHWCGRQVEWNGEESPLVADHLDGNKWNNEPGNLVASCNGCNATRHLTARDACARGHEYTPENTYTAPSKPGGRMCRECARQRSRRRSRKSESPSPCGDGCPFSGCERCPAPGGE